MTTILVIDDEPNLVELIEGYLRAEGYTVATACDGPTALARVTSDRPDLVVLEVMLPTRV